MHKITESTPGTFTGKFKRKECNENMIKMSENRASTIQSMKTKWDYRGRSNLYWGFIKLRPTLIQKHMNFLSEPNFMWFFGEVRAKILKNQLLEKLWRP